MEWCLAITNVDFCSASLRVLYADTCRNLTEAGLANATSLEVLHVADCRKITKVTPFAHRLTELSLAGTCLIDTDTLASVLGWLCSTRGTILRQRWDRGRVGCVGSMPEVGIPTDDEALAHATGLIRLNVADNTVVTTVRACAATLQVLDASFMRMDDAGVAEATALHSLCLSNNPNVHTVNFCATGLLELEAKYRSGLSDEGLCNATCMVSLDISENRFRDIHCKFWVYLASFVSKVHQRVT